MQGTDRLHSLDYLRGLAAFSVMLYHYGGWTFGKFSSEDVLGRLGIYSVSIFYVLSGLTLYHVYHRSINLEFASIKDFFIRRFFRIFPLMWLAMLLDILIRMDMPNIYRLILNVTGLFSILKWEASIGTGVWSIGNELFFYLCFPVFVITSKRKPVVFFLICAVVAAIHIYFAYFIMPAHGSLEKGTGWTDYVNPLNQVGLFLGGFVLGLLFDERKIKPSILLGLFCVSAMVFVFWPVEGDRINLLIGNNRMLFTLLCFIFCICSYKSTLTLPGAFHTALCRLGEFSYSLYLLHPIVYYTFNLVKKKMGFDVPPYFQFIFCICVSLVVSALVYLYFEKYFIRNRRKWLDALGN